MYSKTISELLWQGLQVITVQLCMIFLFVTRRKIKIGIKMFSSLGLDPAGPRWFDGLLWDSWSELRKNTIRYLFACLFVCLFVWLVVFSLCLGRCSWSELRKNTIRYLFDSLFLLVLLVFVLGLNSIGTPSGICLLVCVVLGLNYVIICDISSYQDCR